MKVTNYETSKKLEDIGFEAETYCYYKNDGKLIVNNTCCMCFGDYKAYDLETILEAFTLPEGFSRVITEGEYVRVIDIKTLKDIEEHKDINETLATTAARLLIKLIEEGLC